MARCPTTSGPYRCDREAGHSSECECTPDVSTPAGPAGDRGRASAHLRAILDSASDVRLDGVGVALKVLRLVAEPDLEYRERIWAAR